ncbi:unnamed protein product [Calicophoron daubneyi]|uniref:Uncharacterized protein n=1 Tax=Calicophoron daubneyi TaxID=300641 RepID=A0AAV2T7C8_CALDB
MPKSVSLTNLNPDSEYPICRFQVVDHTADGPVANGTLLDEAAQTTTSTLRTKDEQSFAQSIASMHQRATELLNQLVHRRSVPKRRHYTASAIYDSDSPSARYSTETQLYLDSGGTVHGPMDQKHSTRLGNISRSGQSITGSRYYLTDKQTRHHAMRRQSESGAWDMRSETRSYNLTDTYRGRTFSETRRPLGSEGRYPYQQQYRSTATHNVPAFSPSTHISRWSSMQSAGTHGLWRGANTSNRYATTLTRQHIKRYKEPVEMVVKHPPSAGPSKVDLVSVDTRRESSPQISYSPGPLVLNTYDVDLTTERERRLQDELMVTRRELQDLRRSRSLTGDQHALLPPAPGQNLKSTSTQYLNESSWTTHTLKRNEGQPCGARVACKLFTLNAILTSHPGENWHSHGVLRSWFLSAFFDHRQTEHRNRSR